MNELARRQSGSKVGKPAKPGKKTPGSGPSPSVGETRSSSGMAFSEKLEIEWGWWPTVPPNLIAALEHSGVIPDPIDVSNATPAKTKRRGQQYFQRADGWTVGRDWILRITGERGLEKLDDGKFRKTGDWGGWQQLWKVVEGTAKQRSGTVPVSFDDAAAGGGPGGGFDGGAATGAASDLPAHVLYLPEAIRKQFLLAVAKPNYQDSYFYQWSNEDLAKSQEVGALRMSDTEIIAVRAVRDGADNGRGVSSEVMAARPWRITAYTATVVRGERTVIGADQVPTAVKKEPVDQPKPVEEKKRGRLGSKRWRGQIGS